MTELPLAQAVTLPLGGIDVVVFLRVAIVDVVIEDGSDEVAVAPIPASILWPTPAPLLDEEAGLVLDEEDEAKEEEVEEEGTLRVATVLEFETVTALTQAESVTTAIAFCHSIETRMLVCVE